LPVTAEDTIARANVQKALKTCADCRPGLNVTLPAANRGKGKGKGKGKNNHPAATTTPAPPACAYHKRMTAYVGVYGVNTAEFLSMTELIRQITHDFNRALGNPRTCAYKVEAVLDPQYGKAQYGRITGAAVGCYGRRLIGSWEGIGFAIRSALFSTPQYGKARYGRITGGLGRHSGRDDTRTGADGTGFALPAAERWSCGVVVCRVQVRSRAVRSSGT
jgi:hypothetical protein